MNDYTEIWQLQDVITTAVNACGYDIWDLHANDSGFFWNSPSTWMAMPSICYAASCHWLQTMRDKELMAPCFAYTDSAFYPQINPSTLT